MGERYQVLKYNRENLVALFVAGAFKPRLEQIAQKPQVIFLARYCEAAKIETLVFERDYIDKHFAEDHTGYYARCHANYPKECSRIHFFRQPFDKDMVEALFVSGRGECRFDVLGYHGFVVVKPLPETIIGRTCLAPVGSNPSSRFLTERGYVPNLFGIDLPVRALPFQEQDREVGACATSALWTTLHGTANLYDNPILSPIEITKRAFASLPTAGLALPNDGLDIDQMAGVLRNVGLEADLFMTPERANIQAAANAFLRGNIPIILSFDFNLERSKKSKRAFHAVALSGLGPTTGPIVPEPRTGFLLRATRITKLYAHDDGIGPYSEIKLSGPSNIITTTWSRKRGTKITRARADLCLVPLYSKIRVRFDDVYDAILAFDHILEMLKKLSSNSDMARFEWDIFLNGPSDLKREIVSRSSLSKIVRKSLLTANFPRFFWRAVAMVDNEAKLEFLFDATDLRQGRKFLHEIFYDERVEGSIRFMAKLIQADKLEKIPNLTRTLFNDLSLVREQLN
ncbi:MAG: hypothetical protein WDN10_02785 [bacterium]